MRWAGTNAVIGVACVACLAARAQDLSPAAVAPDPGGKLLYVACSTTNLALAVDAADGRIARQMSVPSPSGLAVSKGKLYVTCAASAGSVVVIDLSTGRITTRIPVGHTPMAPILHPNGKALYVCNRFDNSVSMIDLGVLREVKRIPVNREPVAASITPDGKYLFVANHLHNGRSDADQVAACVTVIDTVSAKVAKNITLPNGSGLLRGVCVSPDGKHVAVTHLLSRFNVPTTQIDRGWINNNALTILDIGRLEVLNTVLLDDIDRGAANPCHCSVNSSLVPWRKSKTSCSLPGA